VTVVLTDKEAAALVDGRIDLEPERAQARSHLQRAAERYLADPAAYDAKVAQAKREMYAKP
jgi:hypothetical protein